MSSFYSTQPNTNNAQWRSKFLYFWVSKPSFSFTQVDACEVKSAVTWARFVFVKMTESLQWEPMQSSNGSALIDTWKMITFFRFITWTRENLLLLWKFAVTKYCSNSTYGVVLFQLVWNSNTFIFTVQCFFCLSVYSCFLNDVASCFCSVNTTQHTFSHAHSRIMI